MQMSGHDTDLPTPVRKGLDRFCDDMRKTLEDQLVTVAVYGGLAKGEYDPASSDVNVLVVLKEVTLDALDKAAPHVRQGSRDFRLEVMLLSENDLRHSTDVFPIKFVDMQRHHRVLFGKDALSDLTIHPDHLRLRCEQEIKNLLLRLHKLYLHRAHHSDLIEGTLTSGISSYLMSVSALLSLKTGDAPSGKHAIAEAAIQELQLDGKLIHDLLALKSGEYEPDAATLKQLYGGFLTTVRKTAEIVDRL